MTPSTKLEVGHIFTWDNFPYPAFGEIKRRWFIYLGDDGSDGIYVYITTATTNMNRKSEDSIYFKKGEYSFEADCIVNILEDFYSKKITKDDLKNHSNDITIKDKLPENKIREIYNKIVKSKTINMKDKKAIHNAFNMSGIYGLEEPKRKK